MANKVTYRITARYMAGREVNAYRVVSSNSGAERKFTRDQIIFLVGKGSITNCKGQMYRDTVILNGVGINLTDLPVIKEEATVKEVGAQRESNGATGTILKRILKNQESKNAIGYEIRMPNGEIKKLDRNSVAKLAFEKRISNASAQKYQDRLVLRGYNCDLKDLPVEYIESTVTGVVDNKQNSLRNTKATKVDWLAVENNIDKLALELKNNLKFATVDMLSIAESCDTSRQYSNKAIVEFNVESGQSNYSDGTIMLVLDYGKNSIVVSLSSSTLHGTTDETREVKIGSAQSFMSGVSKVGIGTYAERILGLLDKLQKSRSEQRDSGKQAIMDMNTQKSFPMIKEVFTKAFRNMAFEAKMLGVADVKASSQYWRDSKESFQVILRKGNAFLCLRASADEGVYDLSVGTLADRGESSTVLKEKKLDQATLRRLALELYIRDNAHLEKIALVRELYNEFIRLCQNKVSA